MDTNRINEELDQWLRNAHAMEEQAEKMLKAPSSRIENYPELAAGVEPPPNRDATSEGAAGAVPGPPGNLLLQHEGRRCEVHRDDAGRGRQHGEPTRS